MRCPPLLTGGARSRLLRHGSGIVRIRRAFAFIGFTGAAVFLMISSYMKDPVIAMLAMTYQMTGDIAQAQALLDGGAPSEFYDWYVQVMSSNAIFLRKYEPAIAMLKTQLSKPPSFGLRLGIAQGNLADLERHAAGDSRLPAVWRWDGQTGRNLRNFKFTIGAQADCEPF